jgi:trk system potassium uptake protein TrkH
VTGLTTVTTATSWSLFGKIVILLLIQIGGLSFTTLFTLVVVQMGRKVTLRDRLTLQASFNVNELSGMVRMVLFVIRGTLIAEGVGAACLTGFFMNQGMGFVQSLFYGVFHSISAFCNAGFDLIGESGFIPYVDRVFFNLVITTLIIVGGIGFTVWRDVYMKLKYRFSPELKRRYRFTLHSRLALSYTAFLILFGTAFFFIYEFYNPETLGPLSLGSKVLASYFQSVTLRTAGFFTISQGGLNEGSKLMSCIMMMIGGSPGGTAGGMKTVTAAVLLLATWSALKGESRINAFGRSLSPSLLQKALTVAVAMLFVWFFGSVALSFTEAHIAYPHSAADVMFEVSSALGTVGLSTGLTPHLTGFGKIVLILCMYIGRIGPLTLVLSVVHKSRTANERIQFPNEEVLIG